jgi:HEAT repeat protein
LLAAARDVGSDRVALPILFDALMSTEDAWREAAWQGLMLRLGARRDVVLPMLVAALADIRGPVVATCARILAEDADPAAAKWLVPMLGCGDMRIIRPVHDVLDRLKARIVPELVAGLAQASGRKYVVKLLSDLGGVSDDERRLLDASWAEADAIGDPAWRRAVESILEELTRMAVPVRTQPLNVPIPDFGTFALPDADLDAHARRNEPPIERDEVLYALRDGRAHVRDNALRLLRFLAIPSDACAVAAAKVLPLVRDADPTVRIAALGTIARFDAESIAIATLAGLADREPNVRQVALTVLGEAGSAAFRAALERVPLQAQPSVVEGLIRVVATLGANAVPVLADILATAAGISATARLVAARGLGALGSAGEGGLSVLVRALTDPLEDVRIEAARAIGLIGVADPAILGALKAQLRDTVPAVRREAALAVARITGQPIDDRGASEARSVPIPGFESELLDDAALGAVTATDDDGHPRIARDLLAHQLRDGRATVRRNAARAIGLVGASASAELVVRLAMGLRDGDPEVRRDVARALLNLGDAALPAAPFAVIGLADPDAEVREALSAVLVGLHPACEAHLLEGLRVEPAAADVGIFVVLKRLEGRVVPLLGKRGLFHASGLVRINAARALEMLARLGADAVVDELRAALADNLGQVRDAAESALDAILGLKPRPVRVLEAVPLPFPDFDRAVHPASHLQQQLNVHHASGGDRLTPALIARLLCDGRDVVRANAARLATLVGPFPELVASLAVLIRDSEPSVRAAAIDGLRAVASPLVAARAITPVLDVSDRHVASAAANALGALGEAALPALFECASRLSNRDIARVLSPIFSPIADAALGHAAGLLAPDGAADDVLRATALRVVSVFSRATILGASDASLHHHLSELAAAHRRSPDTAVRGAAIRALDRLSGRDEAPAAVEPTPLPLEGFERGLLAPEQLESVAGELRFDLLIHCLADGREIVRANAVTALGVLGAAQISAIAPLRRMLRDTSAEVRERAAWSLGRLPPSRDACFELVEALFDGAPRVVAAARDALAAAGTFALEALVFGLDDEPRLAGRTVIPVLVEVGEPALDALVIAVRHASPLVRRNALVALRFFDRERARTARIAVTALERDADRNVRLEARATRDWLDGIDRMLRATEPLPLPHAEFAFRGLHGYELEPLLDSLEETHLVALLRDGRRRVRENAARALGLRRTYHPWLAIALKDDELEVQRAAARALRDLGPAALPGATQLIDALEEDDAPIALDARAALVGFQAEGLPALVAAARMPPDRFRRNLLPIIDRIGEPAVPAMVAALDHASAFVTMNALMAVETLAERGGKVAMARVVELTRHPLPAMVRAAQACLMRLEGRTPAEFRKEAVPMPIAGFDTASLSVDVLVANAASVDRDWIRSAIFDGREKVRENAARLCGCLGPEGSDYISLLVIALKDPETTVQIAAAEALGMLATGDGTAIPALIGALRLARESLRRAVLTALDRFGPARVSAVAVHHLVGLEERVLTSMARVAHRMAEAFVPALTTVAADREQSLIARENAVVILGDLMARARAAEGSLVPLVHHQDGMLAFKAATALGRIGTPGPALADRLMAAAMSEKRPSVVQALRNSAKSLRRRRPDHAS